jgi:hypothetical protein
MLELRVVVIKWWFNNIWVHLLVFDIFLVCRIFIFNIYFVLSSLFKVNQVMSVLGEICNQNIQILLLLYSTQTRQIIQHELTSEGILSTAEEKISRNRRTIYLTRNKICRKSELRNIFYNKTKKLPVSTRSYKSRGEIYCYSQFTIEGWRLWDLLLNTFMVLNMWRKVIGFVAKNVMFGATQYGLVRWCLSLKWKLSHTNPVHSSDTLTQTPSVPPVLRASSCGGIFSVAVSGGVFIYSRWTTRWSPRCCRNSPISLERGKWVGCLAFVTWRYRPIRQRCRRYICQVGRCARSWGLLWCSHGCSSRCFSWHDEWIRMKGS